MGFFSKESDTGESRRTSSRPGEAQANELRVKARRRMIGALTLVIAAIIVVPMLIDDAPPPGGPVSPIVLPAVPPLADPGKIDLAASSTSGSITIEQLPDPEPPDPSTATPPKASTPLAPGSLPAQGSVTRPPASPTPPSASVQPESRPAPKTEPSRNESKVARTDDGAVALALLEGRKPESAKPAAAPPKSGNFILQVAAYTTEQDAAARRSKLVEAGVTNAFVEATNVNGKKAWRLRVGPFPSREAAQAAQTRLRALGYGNGFISSK